MTNTREGRAAAARSLFASLAPPGWREISLTRPQGGHAGTLVVERSDGVRGVFRCLPQGAEALLVERFHRELRILAKLRHPNVMELLDFTNSDACWYISRLGDPFNLYWERRREDLSSEPEEVVSEATTLLRAISAGLAECHAHGIIHRDIKPQNLIVVSDDVAIHPMLIDFGIAHVDDEPRITPLDEAVGNTRYSPSRMQWRQEAVSPWFEAERPAKHYWQRPVDWRFVQFDSRLPTRTIQLLRAIAAQCSAEELAPKDGRGLSDLLAQYFPAKKWASATLSAVNGEGIISGLAQAAADDALRKEEDQRVIQAAYPAAVTFAGAVRDSVWDLVLRLEKELPQCTFRNQRNGDFGSGSEKLLTTANHPGGAVFEFWIEAAGRDHCGFAVRMTVHAHRPSVRGRTSYSELPEGVNPFVFTLGAYGIRGSVKLDLKVMLTLHREGRIVLQETSNWDRPVIRNGIPAEGITVSIQDITDRIAGWCVSPDAWEVVGKEYA